MKKSVMLLILAFVLPTLFQLKAETTLPVYKDASQPVESRVQDLLGRMTLEEKTAQMQDFSFNQFSDLKNLDTEKMKNLFKGISYGCGEGGMLSAEKYAEYIHTVEKYLVDETRLGIPALTTSEAIHGCVHDGCTIFPQAIAQGSTFNPELVNKMAEAIAKEVKAQSTSQVLAPDLDLARELRWGRVEETYGEDPFLVGRMGVAFVKGFKENNVICTPKHYVAHGTPRAGLNLASVAGGERELRSLYLMPFETVIKETHPLSLMNAYSAYDGIPLAASHYLLTDVLRGQLGFTGYVYSDWQSVEMLNSFHKTAATYADAALQAVKAGVDLEIWSDCYQELDSLVKQGILPEKYIDTAVSRILTVKFTVGLFDHPYPDLKDLDSKIHTSDAINLSLDVARESAVLLKNENSILPMGSKVKSIAVIGPSADHVEFGDYCWTHDNKYGTTPLQGLREIAGDRIELNYAKGCDHYSQNKVGFQEALSAVKKSDLAIVFVGSNSGDPGYPSDGATSGESYDLSSLELPGVQEDLIKAVHQTGKPIVVVLVSGKPFAIPWIKEHIPGILVQWYAGERGGKAIAEILFGKANPSGRLNVSFPQSTGHLPVFYNHYRSDEGFYKKRGSVDKPGRDYVFSSPDPLWAFGTGLSYTTFEYQNMTVSKDVLTDKDSCVIDVSVKNTGTVDGKEVIQLYVRDNVSSVETPVKELKAFAKVLIKAGETQTVQFVLPVSELALYNVDMKKVVEPGEFELQVGPASDQILLKKTITVK